ncbi:MAG: hypothetical protein IT340_08510 [Chloroflexi bacterium]|nr:hypothetical protein [Chloroflexota bacterium]
MLDWAVRALSLFNTIALLWLGLTVLLTTERRRWGAWLAGGGLLAAGLLVAAHAVLIESDLLALDLTATPWWRLAWLALVVAPALWLVVMVWYSGRLDDGRRWLALAGLAAAGLAALALVFAGASESGPEYLARGEWVAVEPTPGALIGPAVAVAYGTACIALALLALRRPGDSDRFMGDLARRRARPWLVATSLALLALVLVAGLVGAWLLRGGPAPVGVLVVLAALDLALQGLVAIAVVLLGQAVVAYEVFTGQTLPRRGLRRHWQASLVVAATAGVVIGGSLSLPVAPVARLLLVTVLLALALALLNWRAYIERERATTQLRPFVASQRLVEHALEPDLTVADPAPGIGPLSALREDVLGARLVALVPLGPLAPLVGPPLVDPPTATLDLGGLPDLAATVTDPAVLCRPLPPGVGEPARWVTPLWGEHGLVGLLLLGDTRDGALYTREAIEVARAAGERLLDSRAGAELARRLVMLQRQRLAEGQVIDRQTRRVLHDEVLPRVHAALLALAEPATTGPGEASALLGEVHRELANLLRSLPPATTPDLARLGLLGALRQVIDGELARAFDDVVWQVTPAAEAGLAGLPALTAQVLFGAAREAMRNAARHGRDAPARPLRLTLAAHATDQLVLAVQDDGAGFAAGGRPPAGSGQGLALHETMMTIVGGTLAIEHPAAGGARVTLTVPQD